MIIIYIAISIVVLFSLVIVNIPTAIILLFSFIIGSLITRYLNKYRNSSKAVKIYQVLFIVSSIYMLACYLFMDMNNYKYLIAYDIHNVFYPTIEMYFQGESYQQILADIWSDYQFLDRKFTGYFTYSTLWGLFGKSIGANLFVTLQISTVFLYSFIGVVLYRLMLKCNIADSSAYRNTLIISFCSIVFLYSSIFLRDIHVTLLYIIGIYLTFEKDFSIFTVLKLFLIILITCTFRIESGLFLSVLIPIYLLFTLKKSRNKGIVFFVSVVILIIVGSFFITHQSTIGTIYDNNREHYVDDIAEGSGVVGALQRIPVIGNIASIFYNAIQPVPFWSKLTPTSNDKLGAETYNIMRFPQAIAAIFNWIIVTYILFYIFSNRIRKKIKDRVPKPLQYQLWVGFAFLFIQSAVVEQRRLIPYYFIFYILFFIIYDNIDKEARHNITIISMIAFVVLQIGGIMYLS